MLHDANESESRPAEDEKRNSPSDSQVAFEPTNYALPHGSTTRQKYIGAALVLVVIFISALFGIFSSAPALWTAVRILIVSLIGFHCVAVLTADCSRSWRCAGYPLALTGFMAILTALASIQETARLAPLNAAVADRKIAYDALIYSLKAVIENDCHPKATRALMYSPSPEPARGECERMEHFLPQIEYAGAIESKVEGLNSGEGWGQDIIEPVTPAGAWVGLYDDAARFTESGKRTERVLTESRKTPQSPIAKWAASGAIRYWYFVLAFFLGLQLSKTSAELLIPKAGETLRVAQALMSFFSRVFGEAQALSKRLRKLAS